MNYLNKQVTDAKNNYNYFFVRLIFCIFKILIKISIILLLSGIFNNNAVTIISLIYTIYSIYNIINICKYYFNIIDDIKHTLGYDCSYFEIDLRLFNGGFFKSVVKYGK